MVDYSERNSSPKTSCRSRCGREGKGRKNQGKADDVKAAEEGSEVNT